MNSYQFPEQFIFGAATSAYQIEGASEADGGVCQSSRHFGENLGLMPSQQY